MSYPSTTKDNQCVFCKIVTGEIKTPGIFWENSEFMAFLSIDPNTEGFSVIIPKDHYYSDVMKMPNDVLSRFVIAAKEVTQIIEKAYDDVGRVGVVMEGTGINHAHIKLVPMHQTQDLKDGNWTQRLSNHKDWFQKYDGYISSAAGPSATEEQLVRIA